MPARLALRWVHARDSTTSRQLSEVKQVPAQLVLRWVTTLEPWALNNFAVVRGSALAVDADSGTADFATTTVSADAADAAAAAGSAADAAAVAGSAAANASAATTSSVSVADFAAAADSGCHGVATASPSRCRR